MNRSLRLSLSLSLVFTIAGSAWAIAPKEPSRADKLREPRPVRVAAEEVVPGEAGQAERAARAFVSRRGGTWIFRVDRRTGRAAMVQGSGVPLVPGAGNPLGAEALAGRPLPDGDLGVDTLESLARDFLAAHRDLVGIPVGTLELNRGTSLGRDDGRLWTLHFDWMVGGVPVEGAGVFVRVNSGNVTQFGAPLVGPIAVDPRPVLAADEAIAVLLAYAGDEETARLDEGGAQLRIQPEEDQVRGLDYLLVWVVRWKVRGGVETWEGRVDARTGEVVGFRDVNAYGRTVGGVYRRTVTDPEIRVPFPLVGIDSSGATTDAAGFFVHGGGTISSGLNGRYFDTSCQDGCSNPAQAGVSRAVGAGWIDFGLGGTDAVGNGLSSRADRNAYYHLTQVRRIGKKWLPSLAWLDGTMAANVNIADSCNAFYDGTVNFYRSSSSCNNTGEIADVMQHEWGHGLDGNTRSGDGATGEGTADIVAIHMTHDSRIGPYFQKDGSPVRDIDKNNGRGLLTTSNIGSKCPPGTGPLGYEVHCEGEIIGQTAWDLAQALTAKHGHHTGWRTSERVFFTSLLDQGSYLSTQPFPIYDAYIQADDNDGNLTNGTPNGGEIYTAFNTHGIAGTARTSSPACTRPAQPTVTATPACGHVALAWNAVSGATQYQVLRTEVLQDSAFFPLTTLGQAATSYVDTEVAPDTDYAYVVLAKTASGCESRVENPVAARLVPQPVVSATAAVVDDTPRGNRSGFVDPGEEVDLAITFGNFGDAPANGLTATMVAETAGVTVLQGSSSWPSLAPGGSGANTSTLRFQTDDAQVACGQSLRFRLVPDETSGCEGADSWFDLTLGQRELRYGADFEPGQQGWAVDQALSTATLGDWTWGDPDGTGSQPEDDASADPGHLCWFTAPNPGGLGSDDVDDGVTVLVSPAIDLSGLAQANLSYARWFANRDLGEDAGDFFKADVSSNGGTTWVNLETLGTSVSAATWTRREFDLQNFIPLTSQVRVRFQVADGTAAGNLIEAAVDELRIERAICDDTPACFVAPTFAGLGSALAGGSCGEAELAWAPASTNCQNAVLSYSVYRSTDPGFVPGPGNRIAVGLTGTSFSDSQLSPGVSYTYLVRADDSRSGQDSNLVRRTVVAPTAPDVKAPVFTGLGSVSTGTACGETVLAWEAAVESCNSPVSYEVYRSTVSGFTPSPSNRIASTLSLGFVDAATTPGTTYYYVVRARDGAGNEDTNSIRGSARSGIKDKVLLEETFDAGAAGWATIAPNDAVTGRWEHGDPEGTSVQSPDDHTPAGQLGWFTGLTAAGGDGGNDVDTGTTTLRSARYDLTGAVAPTIRYARWFTNDQGGSPGEDPLDVDVSNDDGVNWTRLEQVGAGTPLAWVVQQTALPIPSTANMRVRFVARDLGAAGSLVEAGMDDFALIDRNQGCTGCPSPVPAVGRILLSKSGNDVVIDWTADPISAQRYVVYELGGPGFSDAVRIGTTSGKTFVHAGAMLVDEDLYYQVSAVNACGTESSLD